MEFFTRTSLPKDIVAVESLLEARFCPESPVIWTPDPGNTEETRLEIPRETRLTLVEILPAGAAARFSIDLGTGAYVNHIRLIAQGADTHYQARVGERATLELSTLILGGDSRNEYAIDCYRESRATLYGLAIPRGQERISNRIRLYHKQPGGQSDQLFRYVADDYARAVFDGKIVVEKDAQKIQAYQKNNNILLSDTARVESDPQLEIYADDVRCSHGATVGQLDPVALFYMRSRGIPYPVARQMLIRSFLDQTLAGVRIDWLADRLESFLSDRLK